MNLVTIGTSVIAKSFIEALKTVDGINLAGIYSRTEEQAKAFAEHQGAPRFYTSLSQMAADEEIDCVYIASPNSLHFEQTILFLENKKHVICEKPIFANLEEWEKAYQVAEENGVFLFEAIRNVYMPNYLALKENLNKVGKVRSVNLSYEKYSSRYDNVLGGEEPNIFSLDYAGGVLVDLGVYPLSIALDLFGNPNHARYYPVIIQTGVDGAGTLVLTYDDFVCTITLSKISTTYANSEIQGETGTFTIDDTGSLSEIAYIGKAGRESLSVSQSDDGMRYEIEAFYDVIKTGDNLAYEKMKQLSYDMLQITEEVRKASGIIFSSEK